MNGMESRGVSRIAGFRGRALRRAPMEMAQVIEKRIVLSEVAMVSGLQGVRQGGFQMKTLKFVLFATLLALAPLAVADPFNPFNTRPVPVLSGPASETPLQNILNSECPGCFHVINDQESAGYWRLVSPGAIAPLIVVEWAGWAGSNIVGMFSGNVVHDIFLGSASGGTAALVQWTSATSGTILGGPGVNSGPFSGISYLGFGFYLRPQGQTTYFYTADDLNPNDSPQAVAYRHPVSNTWWIAFEDQLVRNGNLPQWEPDYNDLVLRVESIYPVPEPAAILLVGSVLLLVGRRLRARA